MNESVLLLRFEPKYSNYADHKERLNYNLKKMTDETGWTTSKGLEMQCR